MAGQTSDQSTDSKSTSLSSPGRAPWLHIVLAALWAVCFYVVWAESPRLWKSPRTALFVFYQPVAHSLCMLWLWALAVWYFERHGVRYDACFASEHTRYLLSAKAIVELASGFTTVLAVSAAVFVMSCARRAVDLAGIQPALMYIVITALLLNPARAESAYSVQRWFFLRTLARVLLPFQAVAFSDFLLADILTSLAKPLSDLAVSACFLLRSPALAPMLRDPEAFDADLSTCGGHSTIVPIFLALPYVLRFVQCLIVLRTMNETPQLFNAIKYTTALPVVLMSWAKYSVTVAEWRAVWKPLWIASAFVNTSYSFYWDVERDWDIRLFHRGKQMLRQDVRVFRDAKVYYALIVINLVLRISWTYKLSSHLRHLKWFVFAMTALEILRRFLWAFVRIEHELRKISGRRPSITPLIPPNDGKAKSREAEPADEGIELARRPGV